MKTLFIATANVVTKEPGNFSASNPITVGIWADSKEKARAMFMESINLDWVSVSEVVDLNITRALGVP